MQFLHQSLISLKSPEKATFLQRFFKTGKGEYAEGDIFLGLTVPQIRSTIKTFYNLSLNEIESSLHSKFHEERLSALLILVHRYEKNPKNRKEVPRISTVDKNIPAKIKILSNLSFISNIPALYKYL